MDTVTLTRAQVEELRAIIHNAESPLGNRLQDVSSRLYLALDGAGWIPRPGHTFVQVPRHFISDVHTAAGLLTHGKRCKALAERLSEGVMRALAATASAPTLQGVADGDAVGGKSGGDE